MTPIDDAAGDPKGRAGKSPAPKLPPITAEPVADPDLLTVTIQAKTGQIVKIESADSVGGRHELTDRKRADLEKQAGKETLEALIEQAFEAGIACVLGEAAGDRKAEESEEEADLRHLLLEPLIRKSPAQRLMQREVLSRAFLGTVVRQAIEGSGPAQQRPGEPAGRLRQRIQPPGEHHSDANLPHQGG